MNFTIERAHLAQVREELLKGCRVVSESDVPATNLVSFEVEHPTLTGCHAPIIEEVPAEQPGWEGLQRRFVFKGWKPVSVYGRLAFLRRQAEKLNKEIESLERQLPIEVSMADGYREYQIHPFPSLEAAVSPVAAWSFAAEAVDMK